MAFLELKNIGKIYVSEGNVAVGIRGVDLAFEKGDRLGQIHPAERDQRDGLLRGRRDAHRGAADLAFPGAGA